MGCHAVSAGNLYVRLCRKLMGRKVGLADLAEVHPEVHRSLVELLAMPGDIIADLAIVFQARQAPVSGNPNPQTCLLDVRPWPSWL